MILTEESLKRKYPYDMPEDEKRMLHEFMLWCLAEHIRENPHHHKLAVEAYKSKRGWLDGVVSRESLEKLGTKIIKSLGKKRVFWAQRSETQQSLMVAQFAMRISDEWITNWHPLSASAFYASDYANRTVGEFNRSR